MVLLDLLWNRLLFITPNRSAGLYYQAATWVFPVVLKRIPRQALRQQPLRCVCLFVCLSGCSGRLRGGRPTDSAAVLTVSPRPSVTAVVIGDVFILRPGRRQQCSPLMVYCAACAHYRTALFSLRIKWTNCCFPVALARLSWTARSHACLMRIWCRVAAVGSPTSAATSLLAPRY